MDLHFFAFFCIFCILILAIKMDLHFFAFFLHPVFWGSIFQLHFFAFFAFISLFLFSRKRHSPTTQP